MLRFIGIWSARVCHPIYVFILLLLTFVSDSPRKSIVRSMCTLMWCFESMSTLISWNEMVSFDCEKTLTSIEMRQLRIWWVMNIWLISFTNHRNAFSISISMQCVHSVLYSRRKIDLFVHHLYVHRSVGIINLWPLSMLIRGHNIYVIYPSFCSS